MNSCNMWHTHPHCLTGALPFAEVLESSHALQDAKNEKFYVFANEGDIYTDAAGSEYSYVTVIDTKAAAVCLPIPLLALHMLWTLGTTPPSGPPHMLS